MVKLTCENNADKLTLTGCYSRCVRYKCNYIPEDRWCPL